MSDRPDRRDRPFVQPLFPAPSLRRLIIPRTSHDELRTARQKGWCNGRAGRERATRWWPERGHGVPWIENTRRVGIIKATDRICRYTYSVFELRSVCQQFRVQIRLRAAAASPPFTKRPTTHTHKYENCHQPYRVARISAHFHICMQW